MSNFVDFFIREKFSTPEYICLDICVWADIPSCHIRLSVYDEEEIYDHRSKSVKAARLDQRPKRRGERRVLSKNVRHRAGEGEDRLREVRRAESAPQPRAERSALRRARRAFAPGNPGFIDRGRFSGAREMGRGRTCHARRDADRLLLRCPR